RDNYQARKRASSQHQFLTEVLPELKLGNGMATDWIFDGQDKEGNWKLKRAEVGITLRHLLLHVSGFGYGFTAEEFRDLYEPYGKLPELGSGATAAYMTPRSFESGTDWLYGCSTDWIGRFVERLSHLTLQEAYQTLVFDPLGISRGELCLFRSKEMDLNRARVSMKIGESFDDSMPFDTPQFDGAPPVGFAEFATAGLWGTVPAYARILESLVHGTAPPHRYLTSDTSPKPLISKALWETATSDGLASHGISIRSPVLKTAMPHVMNNIDTWYPAKTVEGGAKGEGWTMMQSFYNRRESSSGMSVGTIGWAGLANSYWFVDQEVGVGGVILAQFLPFGDEKMMKTRDEFDEMVYKFKRAEF
ncbi:hypothetical protein P7C70_g6313, partial [Phenoliferia sp. Uapishka_3]